MPRVVISEATLTLTSVTCSTNHTETVLILDDAVPYNIISQDPRLWKRDLKKGGDRECDLKKFFAVLCLSQVKQDEEGKSETTKMLE